MTKPEQTQIQDQPNANTADTLGMAPDEMRRLGYRMVDMVVDRLSNRDAEPAILTGTADELRTHLGGILPEEPGDADAAIDALVNIALAHQQHGDHPRYFARVPGPASFGAMLGEWFGTGFNTIAASWAGGSGPTTVELVVTDWLRQLMGMPEQTEGVLLSGGSLANLTAFGAARAQYGIGTVYVCDQTHSSLIRDLNALGYMDDHIRILPCGDDYAMPLDTLEQAVARDMSNGQKPAMVCATAGTTNTGAVDPLNGIADLCTQHDMWFHIDGAYGAPAALCDTGREALKGMERADSLVLDPHKWLFQPYDVGCTLVSRAGALEKAYSMNPEYLKDVQAIETGEVDMRNRSLELSRRSRALKIWLSMKIYGVAKMREAVNAGIEMAAFAENTMRKSPELWEIITPAKLGVVTFALKGCDAAEHEARAKALAKDGFATLSTTKLRGRTVLRLCTINPLTTQGDITKTLDMLARQ